MPMAKLFVRFPYCIIVSLALQKEGDDFSLCAISLIQEQSWLVLQEQNLPFLKEKGTLNLWGGTGNWIIAFERWHLLTTLKED